MATTSTSRSAHPFASQPQDIRSRTQTGVSTSSSQMLPSITCSSCGVSIQMDDLGSHVCQPGKSYNPGSNSGPVSTSSYTASRANLPPSDSFRGKEERPIRRPYDHQHQYQDQQYQHQHQHQQPQQKDRDRDRGLKLDMSQLRPPDTSGFLAAGDSGMAGVGRRGFGGGSPTTPVYHAPFGSSPQTPPSAAMATPPIPAGMGKQNQSQPYFIASHADFNRQGDDRGHGQGQGGSFVPAASYRERGPSPMLGSEPWGASSKHGQSSQNGSRGANKNTAGHREYGRPQVQASSSRSGIPIQLDIKPSENPHAVPGIPDTKNLHSPALVPQTATSGSSSFGLSKDRDTATTTRSAALSPAGNSVMTTMTGSLKTGISGGGTSHPRPEVTPSEWNRKMEGAGVLELVGGGSAPGRYGQGNGQRHTQTQVARSRSRSRSSASTNLSAGTGSTTRQPQESRPRDPPSTRSSIDDRSMEKRSLRVTNASPELSQDDKTDTAVSRWGALRNVVQTAATLASSGIASTIQKTPGDQNASFLDVPSTTNQAVRPSPDRNNSTSTIEAGSPAASTESTSQTGSSGKLPFFERYKKMAENTNGATSMVRQISVREDNRLRKTPARLNPDLDAVGEGEESNVLVESPSRFGFGDKDGQEDSSALPWLRRSSEASMLDRRLGSSQAKTLSDASLSSNGSTSESKARPGDMAIITPSASMNQLDGVAMGTHRAYQPPLRVRDASGPDGELIEGLIEDLKTDLDRLGMLSPNMSVDRRTERESYQSSLLAPSDSISTPGLDLQRRKSDSTKISPQAVPGKRACQKCGVSLKGRRYVKRDGIVLCEADWKEMFLPKCRRCTLPIETSAISSSDGQLKGKWHRECFTCHECDQPFSGESFYVFGDKPYCQLHYHRLNGSLCAATSCRLPIEGPCLLTSGNTRYHPGHLHCDHRDRVGNHSCRNPMEDYYEVGTMKVCERHKDEALRVMNRMAGKRDAAGRMSVAAKAEKRRTRLIQM